MHIKIDLVISANPELLNFLQLLTSGKNVIENHVPVSVTASPEIGEVKKTRAKKTETVAPVEETKQEEPVKEEVKTDLTQEMIIADAVPKSKAGHKDKIKAKVTELGYESITDLQPGHFDEFYAFLQTIPKAS